MSNRFHSKFHRQNHHTYINYVNPDAGHDPIASPQQPFQGDFVLAGALSCVAPLSAAAGYFYSNNTALCAVAGDRGVFVFSRTGIGVQINSVQSTALSAYGANCAANLNSPLSGIVVYGGSQSINATTPNKGIYSYGGLYGGSYYSPILALSAFGGNTGFNVYSPLYGVVSYGGTYGGNFTSKNTAVLAAGQTIGVNAFSPLTGLKAVGNELGILASSPNVAVSVSSPFISLSSGGGGFNRFDNRTGIFKTPQTGFAFDVKGNTYVDGNMTVTGDVSAYGSLSYFETNVYASSALNVTTMGGINAAATFIQYGTQPILVCYDGDTSLVVPSFIVKDTYVGIGTATPNKTLTVSGTISSSSDIIASALTISGDMSASGNLTLGGNLSASGVTISGEISASGNVLGSNLAITNWNSVYSKVNSASANWDSVYSNVNVSSAALIASRYQSPTIVDIISRDRQFASQTITSGTVYVTTFVPLVNASVSQLTMITGATTTAAGITLVKMGLYTWDDSANTGTLVARTANDTALFAAQSTAYSKSFDTTGGYPASYSLVAGTKYAIGFIIVGTTPPTILGITANNAIINLTPAIARALTAQADLPTAANTSFPNNAGSMYFGRLT